MRLYRKREDGGGASKSPSPPQADLPPQYCRLITVEDLEQSLGRRAIAPEDLVRVLDRRCTAQCPLGETLVESGFLTRGELEEAMREYLYPSGSSPGTSA